MMNINMFNLTSTIVNSLCLLLSVAYFSLFERNMLGLIQARLGPNKVGTKGVLQPFSDAIKLLGKESSFPFSSNMFMYLASPLFMLWLSLVVWAVFPYSWNSFYSMISGVLLMLVLSVSVYGVILSGWFSNSKYTLIGSIRAIAQSISFEIPQSICLLISFLVIQSLNLYEFQMHQEFMWLIVPLSVVMISFFICLLAESSRNPFDLPEGESELVSGYMTEYGGTMYTVMFMGENLMTLFSCLLFNLISLGKLSFIKIGLLVIFVVLIRGTFPRVRFDSMMNLCWFKVLPILIGVIVLITSVL